MTVRVACESVRVAAGERTPDGDARVDVSRPIFVSLVFLQHSARPLRDPLTSALASASRITCRSDHRCAYFSGGSHIAFDARLPSLRVLVCVGSGCLWVWVRLSVAANEVYADDSVCRSWLGAPRVTSFRVEIKDHSQ